MIRRVIQIKEETCTGCGLCAKACHEGAIEIQNGKAKLIRDDYCDGLGDCLPECPVNAISFVERDARTYDPEAVKLHKQKKKEESLEEEKRFPQGKSEESERKNWPVQLQLAPLQAPCYKGADLLMAADCTAYAYASFYDEFIRGRVTLIGCPKLDQVSYQDKLTQIFRNNQIQSVTVVRMEVPCCGGLTYAVEQALKASKRDLPLQAITISTEGKILQ